MNLELIELVIHELWEELQNFNQMLKRPKFHTIYESLAKTCSFLIASGMKMEVPHKNVSRPMNRLKNWEEFFRKRIKISI